MVIMSHYKCTSPRWCGLLISFYVHLFPRSIDLRSVN